MCSVFLRDSKEVSEPERAASSRPSSGQGRLPGRVAGYVGVGVKLDDSAQHPADDGRTDGTETLAVRLDEHVVPERSPIPAESGVHGLDSDLACDHLTRRKAERLSALQVASGERAVGIDFDGARDCHGQLDERSRERAVDPLRRLPAAAVGHPEQKLRGVVPHVEKRLSDGPVAIERLEVGSGSVERESSAERQDLLAPPEGSGRR
jgi:hypothetical protein